MKIQFVKDIELDTASGPHQFEIGDIVTVGYADGCRLVYAGYAAPYHSLDIARKLSRTDPADATELNRVTALFDGRIISIRKLPAPIDVTQCHEKPAPWGSCIRFKMLLDKADGQLWPYCIGGGTFCPHAESRKGKGVKKVVSSTDAEKEKPPYEGRQENTKEV
jgi:hypothetical protein